MLWEFDSLHKHQIDTKLGLIVRVLKYSIIYDIIESVLNTNDVFINKHLAKINKINVKDIKIVFKLLGEYNRNKGLKKSTKSNLKTLTKSEECLQQLDARIKILEFV